MPLNKETKPIRAIENADYHKFLNKHKIFFFYAKLLKAWRIGGILNKVESNLLK